MRFIRNFGFFSKKTKPKESQNKPSTKKSPDCNPKSSKIDLCIRPNRCQKKQKILRAPECFFKDKVALVTGGSCGIGQACVKEMLRSGLAGVTVADTDECNGEKFCKEIRKEFGEERGIFVRCDVKYSELIDWAFQNTLNKFKRVDIVVNNAGVLNDKMWEEQISVNLGGMVIGSLLGMQYMSKACCGHGGTIVNIASTFGIDTLSGCPMHCMTQSGIIAFTRSLGYGNHFDRTGVRVMALCPGPTNTKLIQNAVKNCINENFACELKEELDTLSVQDPHAVARGLVRIMCEGYNGCVWVADNSGAYEVDFPNVEEM